MKVAWVRGGKRVVAAAAVLVVVVGVALYATRRSWGPAMIITAPSPEYAPGPLPAGVARAIEVERGDARIRAWLVEPDATPRGTLLLLHGIRSDKRALLPSAFGYAARGFRALAVDSRGHGESSGPHLTYGVEEARDLRALTDVLEHEALLEPPLVVIGTSYGAATAIQFAALDDRVQATIALAPFESLEAVVPAYIEWIGGPLAALVPASMPTDVLAESGRRAHFDPADASPIAAATRIRTPVRIVHSRDDERIPVGHARAIAAALADGQLVELEGPSHNETGAAPEVAALITAWLDEATR